MPVATAMATTFKTELLSAGHCFNATVTPTGTTTTGQPTATSVSSIAGLSVGMGISGGGFPAGTVIASIDSSSQLTASKNSTAGAVGTPLTCTGDVIKVALIRQSASGTYDATTQNYSQLVANSDEASGTGYTAGGVAVTNVTPTSSGTIAYTSFGNATWTNVTITSIGCIFYNSSSRQGTTGRVLAVFAFSGSQVVTAATFTLVMPSATSSTAILRL